MSKMSSPEVTNAPAEVDVVNIGGIVDTSVSLRPGVNVLTGRNATNRTSFLRALMAALGSDRVSLKGDTEQGSVELALGDQTCTRTLRRDGSGSRIRLDGDPYLEESTAANLFAFLLEDNEARQSVVRADELREVMMEPVDVESIRAEIERLEAEKRDLETRLDDLEGARDRLVELRSRRAELEDDLEEKRAELDDIEANIEAADTSVEETRKEQKTFESTLGALRDARSTLEDIRFKTESERESLTSTRDSIEAAREELDELDEVESEIAVVEERIEALTDRKRELDSTVNGLQNLIRFNEEVLDGENDLRETLRSIEDGPADEGDTGSITDQLVADERVCWTCGTEVERNRIESMLERLRSTSREKQQERSDLTSDLDELRTRRRELVSQRDRRQELKERIERLEEEADEREGRLERLAEERETAERRVRELESRADELRTDDDDELLELHSEANEIEFEIGRLSAQLEEISGEVEDVESQLMQEPELENRREDIQAELEALRTKVDELEREAVSQFNDHMGELLEILEYDNLERVWIERRNGERRQGHRSPSGSRFDLHVVRTSESGAAYEDTVDHLSESEREVVGLVFALAGYLVHAVHEELPFVLLDSLEAIDANRLDALIEYFSEYADYLVVALLPEDASEITVEHHRVTDI